METQTTWIQQELKEIKTEHKNIEEKEALKIEEGQTAEFVVDFSQPFEKWIDPESEVVKKIIPVIHKGVQKSFWLNTKNPLYSHILNQGALGIVSFKILRTGQKKGTRYHIVKDE